MDQHPGGLGPRLAEFDEVEVVRLVREGRDFDGSPGVARGPRVGDVGAVVYVFDPENPESRVTVEAVDAESRTIWLADFDRDEVAPTR